MGSWKGRGNQYIQFCTINCLPMASNNQLSHLRSGQEVNSDLRGERRDTNTTTATTTTTTITTTTSNNNNYRNIVLEYKKGQSLNLARS